MFRTLHRWPGLIALVLVALLALSGAALSVFPTVERLSVPAGVPMQTVADLATRVATQHPGVEEIRRAPSGKITAYWFEDGVPGAAVIDPTTGAGIASADPSKVERWIASLHRSLFLGDAGRLVMAIGAVSMLVLSLSGAALVARRVGGWRRWFMPLHGPFSGRLHVEIARVAVFGLTFSAITALWMVASTFDLLPGATDQAALSAEVSGQSGFPLGEIEVLRATPVDRLRDLSFPLAGDTSDVFTLSTDRGAGYIDQGTGAVLSWTEASAWQRLTETIYTLHTGRGAAVLGLILGLMALSVPVLGVTGVLVWLTGRRGRPRLSGMSPASQAGTVVLVGSEGGSTWGFAATLANDLRAAGLTVHVAPMKDFDPGLFRRAERFLILASTYGEGSAPGSAEGFLDRLNGRMKIPAAPFAVLGFGDRSFPAYCAYAEAVAQTARDRGWVELMPLGTVDRQSPQDFARWGHALGAALGIALNLEHQPSLPATETLELISRQDHGAEVQAPTAILRFGLPKSSLWRRLTGQGFAGFQAGDLLGVIPDGSPVPRFYSLVSGAGDGVAEIVVKKHPGGLCSGQLMALEPGQTIRAFVRTNARFHAGRERTPLVLIGAGTGVGPLVGFVRANLHRRPVYLFFGMRHPDSDFLYRDELADWRSLGRLARLVTAISRGARPHYVQDALRLEAAQVVDAISKGAKVMVCGGRDMARGVSDAMAEILAPAGLTPAMLKAEGRYVEDVY